MKVTFGGLGTTSWVAFAVRFGDAAGGLELRALLRVGGLRNPLLHAARSAPGSTSVNDLLVRCCSTLDWCIRRMYSWPMISTSSPKIWFPCAWSK